MSDHGIQDVRTRLVDLFQRLTPINALSRAQMSMLASTAEVRNYQTGDALFRAGETDNFAIFLLKGGVDIVNAGQIEESVQAGEFIADQPLAPGQPRRTTARCKNAVSVLRVDATLLDILLTWQQSAPEAAAKLDVREGDEWISRMLKLTLFQKLPPENLQTVIQRMTRIEVAQGEAVIEQGKSGDYFYVIRQGRCEVTRKSHSDDKVYKLAELAEGDSFGEEALVADSNRNATVRMLSSGSLMRLSKRDFVSLLKQPLENEVDYYLAEAKIAEGARWLDVRLPAEYKRSHFDKAINLPLPVMRKYMDKLDKKATYLLYCDTGRRSATAAFLLNQEGFQTLVLSGGLSALPGGVFLTKGDDPDGLKTTFFHADQLEPKPRQAADIESFSGPKGRKAPADPAALQKQLAEVTAQRDKALSEVKRLRQELARYKRG